MKFKNTPLSISISVTLLSWSLVAEAGTLQNDDVNINNQSPDINNAVITNPDHNLMLQQASDNFWETPNWNSFQTPARSEQRQQNIVTDQTMKHSEFHRPADQAPALQVPTMNEKSFVTEPTPANNATPPAASDQARDNTRNQGPNRQNQAPQRWSNNGMPAMNMPPQMPGYSNNYRPPMPQGYYIPPYQQNPYQRPFASPMYPSMQFGNQPYPPANMHQGVRPPQNMNQPAMSNQPQRNNQAGQAPNPNFVPPVYNRPYNNGYNNRFNNNNWGNNFWGRSGPGTWMNPNKRNMEQGWDDMINAPSRMGTMPGGWNAPEVTMPNPIDLGDQFQENVQDLPEQLRNMDVGN